MTYKFEKAKKKKRKEKKKKKEMASAWYKAAHQYSSWQPYQIIDPSNCLGPSMKEISMNANDTWRKKFM